MCTGRRQECEPPLPPPAQSAKNMVETINEKIGYGDPASVAACAFLEASGGGEGGPGWRVLPLGRHFAAKNDIPPLFKFVSIEGMSPDSPLIIAGHRCGLRLPPVESRRLLLPRPQGVPQRKQRAGGDREGGVGGAARGTVVGCFPSSSLARPCLAWLA